MKYLGLRYWRVLVLLVAIVFAVFACIRLVVRSSEVVSRILWPPRLICEDPIYDLRDVKEGKRCSHEFVIENRGDRELIIESVAPGCGGCIKVAEYPKVAIPPGQSGIVRLILLADSLAEGEVSKHAIIRTNDPNRPTFLLTLKATVRKGSLDSGSVQNHLP